MEYIQSYINRLALPYPPKVSLIYLSQLHYSHFHTIPFENFNMKENAQHRSIYSVIKKAIFEHKRGGICFEFAALIVPFFEKVGFIYRFRLARLFLPTMTPATHQIYIISIEGQDWVFDVGFGAKGPRGLLLLKDGFEHRHPFLSSRISKSEIYGWVVSIKENSKPDADWENIYAFHDIETTAKDIEMAYFYTLYSPNSLLNTNKVASIPTEEGRISIRNNRLTEVKGQSITIKKISSEEEMSNLLFSRFGICQK